MLNEPDGRRWSSRLAEAMTMELDQSTDDAYLRRVAKGERRPQRDMVYRLGEGLRAAGLPWCSGVLALRAHPLYVVDAYGVLDIAGKSVYAQVDDWELIARMLISLETGGGQAHVPTQHQSRSITSFRKMLEPVANDLWPHFTRAWSDYLRRGMPVAHGRFGALYLISTDERFRLVSTDLRAMIQRLQIDKAGPLRRELMAAQRLVNAKLAQIEGSHEG